ncbi:hypothetical protein MPSEU_000413900 [Mayamaea pseudoterrestris]|nr:hypothetical protein MPSEU_000413900 [Mayamaea pseudoterrestris]
MASFPVPTVTAHQGSWGPPSLENGNNNLTGLPGNIEKFATLPYSPFGRSDRLGRVADFTGGHNAGDNYFGRRADKLQKGRREFKQRQEEEEHAIDSFQLVDTTKAATSKRFVNLASKRKQQSTRLRQINARRAQAAGGSAGTGGQQLDRMTRPTTGGRFGGGGPGGRGGGRGYGGGRGGRGTWQNRPDRQPSVAVQGTWKAVEDIDLAKLSKNLVAPTTVPPPSDILWCGFLDEYNDNYDKVTSRVPVALKRMENKEFYPVTTTDDPVLEKLAIDGAGQVFVTDAILAHLMTCTRSVYPWDIVVQKLPNGTLFFDKRDNSQLDYLTVQETSYTPPTDEEGINTVERLGLEATIINQNFSQQILKKGSRKEMDLPNPFFDEDDADGMEPASVAYRYRKFALDESTTVICRTEIHGLVKKDQYMTAFALNEFAPTTSNWRDKIDQQRGAVLATELKNNSFKLAKWTAQSLLAGVEQMKIGFVSRTHPKNNYEHVVLATQFYRPKDFATQITLNEGSMWAMFRMFVNLFQKQEPGKYVLMREPNKAVLQIYAVPPETFEDEE